MGGFPINEAAHQGRCGEVSGGHPLCLLWLHSGSVRLQSHKTTVQYCTRYFHFQVAFFRRQGCNFTTWKRWLAAGRIWELKDLLQPGHCSSCWTTLYPGGVFINQTQRCHTRSLKVGICDFDYAGTSDQFQLLVCSKESHTEEYSDCCLTERSGHVARWWSVQH